MSRWSGGRTTRRLRARGIVLGLTVLVLLAVDVVLVYLALGSVRPGPHAPDASSVAPLEDVEDPPHGSLGQFEVDPGPADAPEPSLTSEAVQVEAENQRLMAARNGSVAWRAERGSGQFPGTLEISGDAGESWWDITPVEEATGAVRPLNIRGPSSAEAVIATGEDCYIQTLTTSNWGTTWPLQPTGVSSVFWSPDALGELHRGEEVVDAPCTDPVDVTSSVDVVPVLCSDDHVQMSPEPGAEWHSEEIPGAKAVAASQRGILVAGQIEGGDGIGLVTVQGEPTPNDDCVPGVNADEIAVEVTEDIAWLLLGKAVAASAGEERTIHQGESELSAFATSLPSSATLRGGDSA